MGDLHFTARGAYCCILLFVKLKWQRIKWLALTSTELCTPFSQLEIETHVPLHPCLRLTTCPSSPPATGFCCQSRLSSTVWASGKGALISEPSSPDYGFAIQGCFSVLMAHRLSTEQVPPPAVLSKKTTGFASLRRQGTGITPCGSGRLCITIS